MIMLNSVHFICFHDYINHDIVKYNYKLEYNDEYKWIK